MQRTDRERLVWLRRAQAHHMRLALELMAEAERLERGRPIEALVEVQPGPAQSAAD